MAGETTDPAWSWDVNSDGERGGERVAKGLGAEEDLDAIEAVPSGVVASARGGGAYGTNLEEEEEDPVHDDQTPLLGRVSWGAGNA